MPQPCTICTHPNRPEIDRLIVSGEPNRRIASRYGVSEASIRRHRVAHLPQKLVKAQAAKEVAQADTLLGEVRTAKGRSERLYAAAEDILERALKAADLRTALRAIAGAVDVMREARAHLELKGEITGELGQGGQGAERIMIVVPARVPLDSKVPLNMSIAEDVIDVPLVEEPGPGRRMLPGPSGEGGRAA
jgi:hypothetical protein